MEDIRTPCVTHYWFSFILISLIHFRYAHSLAGKDDFIARGKDVFQVIDSLQEPIKCPTSSIYVKKYAKEQIKDLTKFVDVNNLKREVIEVVVA